MFVSEPIKASLLLSGYEYYVIELNKIQVEQSVLFADRLADIVLRYSNVIVEAETKYINLVYLCQGGEWYELFRMLNAKTSYELQREYISPYSVFHPVITGVHYQKDI